MTGTALKNIDDIWSRPWRFWLNCDQGWGGGRKTGMRGFMLPHVSSQDWEQLEEPARTQEDRKDSFTSQQNGVAVDPGVGFLEGCL